MTVWTLDDRVDLVDWQPTDRVWLTCQPAQVGEPRQALPRGRTDSERRASDEWLSCVVCSRWVVDTYRQLVDGSALCNRCETRAQDRIERDSELRRIGIEPKPFTGSQSAVGCATQCGACASCAAVDRLFS